MSVAFNPKLLDENINISKQPPLKEFFKLLIGIAIAITAVYVLLGFIVDITVPLVPVSIENKIGSLFTASLKKKTSLGEERHVQSILDTLLSDLENNAFDITISVARSPMVNAVALPGGHIIIFEGLLKEIKSDRELAFVIGHEIGHFVNRDHLKGLGRGLSLAFIALILGNDNRLSDAILSPLNLTGRRFSQKQESRADAVGLELLYKAYGTTEGSVSFFRMLEKENKISDFAYFFSSHPSPKKRIANLETLIKNKYSRKAPQCPFP